MELYEYIHRGGAIVYLLIALNIIGFSIMLWKFFQYTLIKYNTKKLVSNILEIVQTSNGKFEEKILQNAMDKHINTLETGLNTVKIIASIAPLLGLLGTVIGVLNAFDSMTHTGLQNPSIFSNGISIALITTVAGLIVAIPHYIGYNYLIGYLNTLEHIIEKKVISKQ